MQIANKASTSLSESLRMRRITAYTKYLRDGTHAYRTQLGGHDGDA
jgi:hypothetical protein